MKHKTKNKDHKKKQRFFKLTNDFSVDPMMILIASKNRYKAAFLAMLTLCIVMGIAIISMMPLVRSQLVVVHTSRDGTSFITTTKDNMTTNPTWLQTQSNIAQYVMFRFGYDPLTYKVQAKRVSLQSSEKVNAQYQQEQLYTNTQSPVHEFKNKGYRTVVINSVLPLSKQDLSSDQVRSHNVAEVNYTTYDHLFGQNSVTTLHHSALVSWTYKQSLEDDANDNILNWDGFMVTSFVKTDTQGGGS